MVLPACQAESADMVHPVMVINRPVDMVVHNLIRTMDTSAETKDVADRI